MAINCHVTCKGGESAFYMPYNYICMSYRPLYHPFVDFGQVFLGFSNLMKQLRLWREWAVRIPKEEFLCTVLSLLLAMAKIGLFGFDIDCIFSESYSRSITLKYLQ